MRESDLSKLDQDQRWMERAIKLSAESMNSGGGPFGAVVICENELVAEGSNSVTASCDPTAHAEVVAIRLACQRLGRFELNDCSIYASCEPCPMCFGAIYWARIREVVYGCARDDAASVGFDDAAIYEELDVPPGSRRIPMRSTMSQQAKATLERWRDFPSDRMY